MLRSSECFEGLNSQHDPCWTSSLRPTFESIGGSGTIRRREGKLAGDKRSEGRVENARLVEKKKGMEA